MKPIRLPLACFSVLSLASIIALAACSTSSAVPAAPFDPGTVEPTPDGGDPPSAEAGGPDAPVTPPVAPGAVDPSFGTKGVASGSVAATPTIRFSRDGRTVVFEHKTNVYATLTALVANGTPDKSHGADGVAEVPIPNAMNHSQSLSASARIENDGSGYVSGGIKQEGITTSRSSAACRTTRSGPAAVSGPSRMSTRRSGTSSWIATPAAR